MRAPLRAAAEGSRGVGMWTGVGRWVLEVLWEQQWARGLKLRHGLDCMCGLRENRLAGMSACHGAPESFEQRQK